MINDEYRVRCEVRYCVDARSIHVHEADGLFRGLPYLVTSLRRQRQFYPAHRIPDTPPYST